MTRNMGDETMTQSTKLTLVGATKQHREMLKRAGWRWQPAARSWTRQITAEQSTVILGGGDDAVLLLRRLRARCPGCLCYLNVDGAVKVVFRSESYVDDSPRMTAGEKYIVRGSDYCDAAGNYIGGGRVRGSAPDDLS